MASGTHWSPRWSRVVLALIGAFAAVVLPVVLALALGLNESNTPVAPLIVGVLIYSGLFLAGIFWSGQWATRIDAPADARVRDLAEVRAALLALNGSTLHIEETAPGEFTAEWHGAARVRTAGMTATERTATRTHIRLVDATHEARVYDVTMRAEIVDNAEGYQWHASAQWFRGIRFESFSPTDRKHPIADAVLSRGWAWQPVIFR
jgi:hypothetical protein